MEALTSVSCAARCDHTRALMPTLPEGTVVFSDDRALFGTSSTARLGDVMRASLAGRVAVLVIDARGPALLRAEELLAALYDDPRRPRRLVHPHRVLSLIEDDDVEAAFALGRYGLGGIAEVRALGTLGARARSLAARPAERVPIAAPTTPLLSPPRTARLGAGPPGEPAPVAIGHAHAPETLEILERYVRVLRAARSESSVFGDVATLLRVLIDEGLSCQTNLATKAGVTHSGQFIGSFEFYRSLRRTRYAAIPDPPESGPAMEVFIAIDEVIHEVLHLLFLANVTRTGRPATHTEIAEEVSLTWWQAVIHQRVWGEWLADRHILEINDDFTLSASNAEARGFFRVGTVFERYATYPWIPYVLARLPERAAYIGERPDRGDLVRAYAMRPEAAFLTRSPEHLRVPGPFASYPRVPETLRVPSLMVGVTPRLASA